MVFFLLSRMNFLRAGLVACLLFDSPFLHLSKILLTPKRDFTEYIEMNFMKEIFFYNA